MTWRSLMKQGFDRLVEADIPDAESDIRILAMHVLACNYSALILRMEDAPTPEDAARFLELVRERAQHKPCQYLTGVQNFMGYDFHTAPGVLIPRSETELLVEEALRLADGIAPTGRNHAENPATVGSSRIGRNHAENPVTDGRNHADILTRQTEENPGLRVLDLCCGTGCIGISYALLRGGRDHVVLVDISEAAIAVAEENNRNLQAGCEVCRSDLFAGIDGTFDRILSNPPYIRSDEIPKLMPEVRDFEPHLALDGHADGLYFYRRIIREARNYLNENGYLLFEIGCDQLEAVRGLFVENGYEDIIEKQDYAGLDRIVGGRSSHETKSHA